MKFLVLVAVCASVASASRLVRRAVPGYSGNDAEAPIIKSGYEANPNGYDFSYETGNGIKADASGVLKKFENGSEAIVVQGQYSYTGPDNKPISVTYIADEEGYHAEGAHLPVPPPIPEAIQRSVQYVLAHPQPLKK